MLPFIVLIGAMFLMTRSAKKKQRQAMQMRDQMQPGTGVRTIGGMYATVKEIRDDVVLLEVAPGVHALYGKNAIGAVLEADEFDRIVNGLPAGDGTVVPDDASSLTSEDGEGSGRIDLGKSDEADTARAEDETSATKGEAAKSDSAEDEAAAEDDAQHKDTKREGDSDSK
nr:preprotein translocase subunit YajC [Streptomyces sp. HNM0574]